MASQTNGNVTGKTESYEAWKIRSIKFAKEWTHVVLWLATNLIFWLVVYFRYENEPEYHYIRLLAGKSLPFAKACAACLNLNSMLILFPVCRNLISFFRSSVETKACCKRSVRRLLDKNLVFHKTLAYVIILFTLGHINAHYFNFENLFNSRVHPETDIQKTLSFLPYEQPDTWVNPVQNPSETTYGLGVIQQVMQRVAGWTGIFITMALLLMYTSSTEFIRRYYFETFWFTHHLFIIYYGFLIAHGAEGIVRYQTNVEEHNPKKCADYPDSWSTMDDCKNAPMFAGGELKVIQHPSNAFEIRMKKSGFEMLPGQYIFIKCPQLSNFEWHPFTLTSSPNEDFFSVHIRTVGDWTNGLAEACGVGGDDVITPSKLPRVAVDGPFGTASIDIFKYKVGVCVAAGIGVTPFASILKTIWHRLLNNSEDMKLSKVYFFWICPETNAFAWFSELLEVFERDMVEKGYADFLNYNIYLTRGLSFKETKNIYLSENENTDPITGLRQKTHYGRPKWPTIFSEIANENQGIDVGVFFCGPSGLSEILYKNCKLHSEISRDGCRFFYNKENF
ncbi:cytochrome b-245 heavy chain-like isoform X2 [Anneissia japonica]|uniref:cytochrome b-245 heavy chain-like isoform X2 n=1 Tax=Anneissia japonica TaxID=1529436 RepID=UPI0014254BD3|nr:cytochrome b-245 heavy chain-like isoform X2 [Anneissia japonica]